MKIILSPLAANKTTKIKVDGLKITINGKEVDLSQIPDGGEADGVYPLIGKVTRDEVTIAYEYDSKKAEPNQSPDIKDYTFEIDKGDCPCPIKWRKYVKKHKNKKR